MREHTKDGFNSNWTNEANSKLIFTGLAKAQPSSTFAAILFLSDAIESENLFLQTDIAMNTEEEWRYSLHEVLPIISQVDPYIIQLLGQQKYIEIV